MTDVGSPNVTLAGDLTVVGKVITDNLVNRTVSQLSSLEVSSQVPHQVRKSSVLQETDGQISGSQETLMSDDLSQQEASYETLQEMLLQQLLLPLHDLHLS